MDYSVYLVTGRELLPEGKDYYESLEQSLKGGVTIVQIREKSTATGEFLDIARKSKEICRRYNVPILINDRIDIALAMGADGVHVGQSDMPVDVVRALLPSGSIVGLSCNTLEEVRQAVVQSVDYVGVGPVYPTSTKKDANEALGVRYVGTMLAALKPDIKAVAIGGIKAKNALRVMYGAQSISGRSLDGLAVVSDIVGSQDPEKASKKIANIISSFKRSLAPPSSPKAISSETLVAESVSILSNVRKMNPLIHQITNAVVVAQSANITLALGASPIMATSPEEMQDLAQVCGALLINIGTINPVTRESMHSSGALVNAELKPVVMDPVGVGASALRKTLVKSILDMWQASVIKGNAGELAAIAGSTEVISKGVDTVGSGFKDPHGFVKHLALKERCVVVMTGPVDYISDGHVVVEARNGHSLLGQITGSGCGLGTVIACCCAAASEDAEPVEGKLVKGNMLAAAVSAVLALTIAAEIAAEKVEGPGGFLGALLDALSSLTSEQITSRAKIVVSY